MFLGSVTCTIFLSSLHFYFYFFSVLFRVFTRNKYVAGNTSIRWSRKEDAPCIGSVSSAPQNLPDMDITERNTHQSGDYGLEFLLELLISLFACRILYGNICDI